MTTVHIDPHIPFADFAKAMSDLGYELRTAPDGTLKVVKRRVKKSETRQRDLAEHARS